VTKSKTVNECPSLYLFSGYEKDVTPLIGYTHLGIKDLGIFDGKIFMINEHQRALFAFIP